MARRPGKPEPKTRSVTETTVKPESNDPRKNQKPTKGSRYVGSVSDHPNSPMSRGY